MLTECYSSDKIDKNGMTWHVAHMAEMKCG
jgi:hypothetical protein